MAQSGSGPSPDETSQPGPCIAHRPGARACGAASVSRNSGVLDVMVQPPSASASAASRIDLIAPPEFFAGSRSGKAPFVEREARRCAIHFIGEKKKMARETGLEPA